MPKILVVEDDPIVQELCKAVLSREGFESIIKSNGLEGLETFLEKHAEIDLILSDVIMPRMNGIEMVRQIFTTHAHVSVVMMSGHGLSKMVPEDLTNICAILLKPFTHAQLVTTLYKCLRPGDELISRSR